MRWEISRPKELARILYLFQAYYAAYSTSPIKFNRNISFGPKQIRINHCFRYRLDQHSLQFTIHDCPLTVHDKKNVLMNVNVLLWIESSSECNRAFYHITPHRVSASTDFSRGIIETIELIRDLFFNFGFYVAFVVDSLFLSS